jgi:hypothetical protein
MKNPSKRARHVTRNLDILVEKLQGNSSRRRWEAHIKVELRKIGCGWE